jgi:hypothetical protein
VLLLAVPADAGAIPAFARKYNASCSLCHSAVPRLNAFGEEFAGNGFEMVVGEQPRDTLETGDALLRLLRRIDIALRMDLFGTVTTPVRQDAGDVDLQAPYGVKLLTGGVLAERISYYMYFYMTERGEVAGLEDAYVQFTDIAGTGVSAIVGQFQVSDPLFKRELRLPYEDYQVYRVRVGQTRADLTYDRGFMATWSPRDGTDLTVQLVNGRGLDHATDSRQYDTDDFKTVALRLSQDAGPLRIGGFAYAGTERGAGALDNRIRVYGPDATLALGDRGELNLQYLRRTDDGVRLAACSGASCPAPLATTVDAMMAELIFWPQGVTGRWWATGLVNWISADAPVMSLRLGEQGGTPPYLDSYRTASAGLHYILRRNVRLLGEGIWNFDQDALRLVTGFTVAF